MPDHPHTDRSASVPPAAHNGRPPTPPEPNGQDDDRSLGRRLGRGVLYVLGGLLGLIVVIVLAVVLLLQTGWGADKAKSFALERVNMMLDGATLEAGRVGGSFVSDLALYDVTLTRDDGTPLAHIDTLTADYRLLPFLQRRAVLQDVYLGHPQVWMHQRADSSWDLANVLVPDTTTQQRQPFALELNQVRLRDGQVAASFYAAGRDSVYRAEGINVRLSEATLGENMHLQIDTVTARVVPGWEPDAPLTLALGGTLDGQQLDLHGLRLHSPRSQVTGHGRIALPSEDTNTTSVLDFTLQAQPLAFSDLRPFLPHLDPDGSLTLDLNVGGTLDQIEATIDAAASDGAAIDLAATFTPPGTEQARYRVAGTVRQLNPAFFTGNAALNTEINGEVDLDLAGPSMDAVSGPVMVALGPVRLGDLSLAATTVEGRFDQGQGQLSVDTGVNGAGLTLRGTVRPFDAVPRYDLDGRLAGFDAGRFGQGSGQDASTLRTDLNARFALDGSGLDLQTAQATANVTLAPSQINNIQLQQGFANLRFADGVVGLDTRLVTPDGAVAADGTLRLGDVLAYTINEGTLDNLDLAAFTGDTLSSAFNGRFALQGTGLDPQTMALTATLDLRDSFYGTYTLDDAAIRARLSRGALNVVADADLGSAGGVALDATVRPFLAVPRFDLTRATLTHFNVGALLPASTQQTDLNGTLTARGQGFDPATMRLTADVQLGPSQVNSQPLDALQLRAELDQGRLRYDARLDLPEGTTTLAGTARPFAEPPSYTVEAGTLAGLNVGALMGRPDLQTSLNGTLTLDADGLDPATMSLSAALNLNRSTINDAVVQDGTLTARVAGGAAHLETQLDLAEGGVQLTADGRFGDGQIQFTTEGHVRNLDLGAFTGQDSLATRLTLGFDLEGRSSDAAAPTVEGQVYASNTTYGTLRLDTLHTRFRLHDGLLRVDSLQLRSNLATATAGGTLALPQAPAGSNSDFRFQAQFEDIGPLRQWINTDLLVMGEGALEGTIVGADGENRLAATLRTNNLIYNDLRMAGLNVSVQSTLSDSLRPELAEVNLDASYISTPRFTIRQTDLQAVYQDGEVSFEGDTRYDDRRDVQFTGRLDLNPGREQIQLDRLDLRLDDDQWTLHQPTTITYKDGLRIDGLNLSAGDQQIRISGTIDPNGTQDFTLDVDSVRIGALTSMFGLPGLDGTLSTSLRLTGAAGDPQLDGRLTAILLAPEATNVTVNMDVRYDARRLHLDGAVVHPKSADLKLEGFLPLDLSLAPADTAAGVAVANVQLAAEEIDGTVDLRVTADGMSIDWLGAFASPASLTDLRGRLFTDIQISGTFEDPTLTGDLRLADAQARIPNLGVTYEQIAFDALLKDNQIVIQQARLVADGGTMTAQGQIDFPALSLGQYNIDATLDRFRAIDSEQYRARVSGGLKLQGTTDAPEASGTLKVNSADVYLGSGAQGNDLDPVALTQEDLLMLERNFGYRISESDTTNSAFYDALTMDIDVELERDTWIRKHSDPQIAIQLTGRLEVNKAPQGELLLYRTIEVLPERSFIRQFGRRFDIAQGTLTFNGPVSELNLNVDAAYDIQSRSNPGTPEATITLSLDGHLDDLEITLGSDPPMDNTDIVSYIATGRPANQALQFGGTSGDTSDGLLTQGGALAANQLAGAVEGFAEAELGLDVIEIQQDGLRGTQLIAGSYISPRVYVGVSQPIVLNSTEEQTSGAKPTELTMEYELFEWLLLRVIGGTASSSVRVNLTGRYAFR